ncbi:MFS transporter [bacterium]|nr:MAG: MFS transporter [bacterium]
MAIVREELDLTKAQIGNTIIASVSITILARFLIGWLCDHVGPRLSYTVLLMVGSLPVMGLGLADDYTSFLLFRLGIGVIGASFVITQYHTSVMFAPNVVGTANATSAGWGNLGGGVTQIIMPLVFAAFVGLGYTDYASWRLSMVVAGAVCFVTGIAYYFFTQDLPDGNFKELRARGEMPDKSDTKGTFWVAARDRRVWMLFLVYAACFGIELTINNIAALYYIDNFGLGLKTAGLVAGLFGLMNIFARTTGGLIGDRFGFRWGLRGRVRWLFIALFIEGIALMVFSRMTILPIAIGTMIVFSLFVQMSEGATYSVVPFINRKALGSIAGIVGAGGNMGAVSAGFLLRVEAISWSNALLILGAAVLCFSFFALLVKFSPADEKAAAAAHMAAVQKQAELQRERKPKVATRPRFASPLTALRIYLGIALAIKGIYFITNLESVEAQLGGLGPMQDLAVWFVVFAHAVGGAALALGFATRAAAAVNIIVMLGAVVTNLMGAGMGGILGNNLDFQFSALVLVILAVFFWRGSGRFALDRVAGPATDQASPQSQS